MSKSKQFDRAELDEWLASYTRTEHSGPSEALSLLSILELLLRVLDAAYDLAGGAGLTTGKQDAALRACIEKGLTK